MKLPKGEGLIESGDSTGYKRIVVRLRWVTIIVTSYIILLGRGISLPQILPSLLILFYLLSNLIACFLPSSYFFKIRFFYMILLFDTFMVSLGIYLTSQFNTDFYLVYFLIIIFASIARSFKLLMINALGIGGIHGWVLWTKGWNRKSFEEGVLLRVPFIPAAGDHGLWPWRNAPSFDRPACRRQGCRPTGALSRDRGLARGALS